MTFVFLIALLIYYLIDIPPVPPPNIEEDLPKLMQMNSAKERQDYLKYKAWKSLEKHDDK